MTKPVILLTHSARINKMPVVMLYCIPCHLMYKADQENEVVKDIYKCPRCGNKTAIHSKRKYTPEQIEAETKS